MLAAYANIYIHVFIQYKIKYYEKYIDLLGQFNVTSCYDVFMTAYYFVGCQNYPVASSMFAF